MCVTVLRLNWTPSRTPSSWCNCWPAMFLIAPLHCFYLLLFGLLLGTATVLTILPRHTPVPLHRGAILLDHRVGTFIGRRRRPRPWPHCVRWGPSSPKRDKVPNFRPMSVVAKRSPISATAWHVFWGETDRKGRTRKHHDGNTSMCGTERFATPPICCEAITFFSSREWPLLATPLTASALHVC